MIRISANNGLTAVKGLDTSHYDLTVDFKQVKANGYEFCWGKCTEGIANTDVFYLNNKRRAKDAGLTTGAYHFFRPYQDPLSQAEWFLNNAYIEKGDLRPMFDWEVRANDQDPHKAQIFLDKIEKEIGVKPFIYGSPFFLDAYGLAKTFSEYPLVIAHYGTMQPLIPSPWKTWAFHQFTDKGSIHGVPTNADLDRFNGSLDDLKKFII